MKNLVIAVMLTLCAVQASAQGSKFNVNCGKSEKINSLLKVLTKAAVPPPITINVSGTCKESVLIQNFDRLTLNAKPGAVIVGASKNVDPAIFIVASDFVTVQGFTVQGGVVGVQCGDNSVCNLISLTVEMATTDGVVFARSGGDVISDVLQNNAGRGLVVRNGSKTLVAGGMVQGNGGAGIAVISGSQLTLQSALIQNNAGSGVRAAQDATVRLSDNTISANGGHGIFIDTQSNASLEQDVTGNVVTGNGGVGVLLGDLSFAQFVGVNNVSGNVSQPDVACLPQFSATRGAGTVGGTTDCNEPAAPKSKDDEVR